MSSSASYAERCANWLRNESPKDTQLIEKEITRFSTRLDQLQHTNNNEQQVDDLLATLQLLENHLTLIQAQTTPTPIQEAPAQPTAAAIDLTPLVDPSIQHEIIDDDTKAQRLSELLSHPGIQKGFISKS